MQERQLVENLDVDLVWRRRDILALFGQCSSKNREVSSSARRAIVAMMYAHWEGYVKRVSCDYAEMLSAKRLRYRNMKPCFRGLIAIEHITILHEVKKRIFVASETVEKISSIGDERVIINLRPRLEKIGNLDFEMFTQIISFIGLPTAHYETKKIFIDERLLAQRNRVAHGEYIAIDFAGVGEIKDNVFELLELFRNDIQNAVTTKSYMA